MVAKSQPCELSEPEILLFGDEHAYVRYDNNSLSPGHVLVIPRYQVPNFFDMSLAEKMSA